MSTANIIEMKRESHTAQKIHQCDECGNKIGPGENYTRDVSAVDGPEGREVRVEKGHVRDCTEGPSVVEEDDGQLMFT